jgi:serine/threonine-protein kinase HipA
MENIIQEIILVITNWKKIAGEIGISKAEMEMMANAFKV